MSNRIVYLLGALHKPDNISRILCQKINWLADNTEYKIHVVLTEQTHKPPCYELSSKVQVVNLGINYDELSKYSYSKRLFCFLKKQKLYEKRLKAFLLEVAPAITVAVSYREAFFLYRIKDGSYKLGEIHFDKRTFREVNYKFLPAWLNHWATLFLRFHTVHKMTKMDLLVTDTEEVTNEWKKFVSHVVFIPNPLKEYPEIEAGDTKKVLAIGDFCQGKGFDQLIQAWERIAPKYQEWRLHLYGDGNQEPYKEMIRERKLSRSIQCYSRPDNLYDIYARYSLLVQTYEHDKFGRHLMEAMAFGLPCIAYDVPYGPKELIQDEKNGFLVVSGHLSDFTSKLGIIIHDEDYRREMQQQARQSVRPYMLENIMPHWIEIFEKLSHGLRSY